MPLANLLWWPPQAKSSLSWGLAPPLHMPWCDLMLFLNSNWGKGFSHVLFSLFFSDCSSLHVLTLDVYMFLVTDMSRNHLTRIVTVWRAIMWSYHTHYRCDLKQFPGCLCLEFVWLHSIQQDDFMYWRRVFWMQSPSWACAWDLCNPNQIYTGLQVRSLSLV